MKMSSYCQHLLDHRSYFHVHSIFDHGFNIALQDGRILYLTYRVSPMSVLTILVDKDWWFEIIGHLEIGTLIKISNDNFIIYGDRSLRYLIECQVVYDSSFSFQSRFQDRKQFLLEHEDVLLSKALNYYKTSGFLENKNNIERWIEDQLPIPEIDLLNLVGLGMGLTPSGDDFIIGYLLSRRVLDEDCTNLIYHILKLNSTTEISHSFYKSLLNRQVDLYWRHVFESIDNQDVSSLLGTFNVIQTIGHTSGSDQLLGFLIGCLRR